MRVEKFSSLVAGHVLKVPQMRTAPKTAAAILGRRPFRDLDDLSKVPGLGPRALERLAPWVAFGEAP